MLFRFGTALLLVVAVSLAGTALEKRSLELKRLVSRQCYRLEVLEQQYAARRVLAQQLGAPGRLVEQWEAGLANAAIPEKPVPSKGSRSSPKGPKN